MKFPVPHNGPLAGFLEMEILERAAFIADDADEEDEEDRDFQAGAALIRAGWKGTTLEIPDEHARLVMATLIVGCNSLDDQLEHERGDRESMEIDRRLMAAGGRLVDAIARKSRR